jgi:hypothetical protein
MDDTLNGSVATTTRLKSSSFLDVLDPGDAKNTAMEITAMTANSLKAQHKLFCG